MYVFIRKDLVNFENCFGLPSRFCQEMDQKTSSHSKCLRGQHNCDAGNMLPRAAGRTALALRITHAVFKHLSGHMFAIYPPPPPL
jgi:hypothetical protein